MINTNINTRTLEVCKKVLAKRNLSDAKEDKKETLSECVVFCKQTENGLFDITKGVAKIEKDQYNINNNHFIISQSTKIMFIVE